MKNLLFILAFIPITLFGQEHGTISVFGHAEKQITPDIIWLNVSFSEYEKAKDSEWDEKEKALENLLKKCKISTEDVEILQVSGYKSNYYSNANSKIRFAKNFNMKLKEPMNMSDLILELFEIGASDVSISSLEYTQKDEIQKEVSKLALENAREKANMMLESQGSGIGQVISIREQNERTLDDDENYSRNYSNNYRSRMYATGAVSRSAGSNYHESPFNMGKITIEADVRVVYSIE